MAKKNSEFVKGDLVKCVHSASPGYKVGEVYSIDSDEKGNLYVEAGDGFKDYLNMVVSKFVKFEETAAERALRVWNKNGQKGSGPVQQPTTTQS